MGRPFPAYSRGRLAGASPHRSMHGGSTIVPGKSGDFFCYCFGGSSWGLTDADSWQHPCPPCVPCTLHAVSTAQPLVLVTCHFSRSITLSCPPLSAALFCRTHSSTYILIGLCLHPFCSQLPSWIHPKSHLPVIVPHDSPLSTLCHCICHFPGSICLLPYQGHQSSVMKNKYAKYLANVTVSCRICIF